MSKVILLTITLAGEPTDEPAEMPYMFTSADKANGFPRRMVQALVEGLVRGADARG